MNEKLQTDRQKWRDSALLFGVFLVLYVITLAPTVVWEDSADLALRIFDLAADRDKFLFTARDYLLYRYVGQLFVHIPIGDIAWRTNFMSAFFGALTVGVTYFNLRDFTGNRLASVCGAAVLGVSHTFWFFSVVTEVYAMACFLAALMAYYLLRWELDRKPRDLILASLFLGLSISHHGAGALLVPGMCFFFLARAREIKPWLWGVCIAVTFVGGGFFLYETVAAMLIHQPVDSGSYELSLKKFGFYMGNLAFNFPFIGFFIGIFGVWKYRSTIHGKTTAATVIVFFLTCATWSVVYWSPAAHNQFITTYQWAAIMVGWGIYALMEKRPSWVMPLFVGMMVVAPISYAVTPRVLTKLHVDVANRHCPNRDNNWYYLFPPKTGYQGVREYAESALASAAPNSMIFADYTVWRPLRYLQVTEGVRKDVTLVFSESVIFKKEKYWKMIDDNIDHVYFAAESPLSYYGADKEFLGRYELKPVGFLAQISRKP